jgi:hypothetical protein
VERGEGRGPCGYLFLKKGPQTAPEQKFFAVCNTLFFWEFFISRDYSTWLLSPKKGAYPQNNGVYPQLVVNIVSTNRTFDLKVDKENMAICGK